MGILSILDEESIYPKASDKTLIEKLKKNHDGKSPKFKLPKMSAKNKAHFEIEHYAGTVCLDKSNTGSMNKLTCEKILNLNHFHL